MECRLNIENSAERSKYGHCERGKVRLHCVVEIEATYMCAHCLQINYIIVDGSGGEHQEYIEDCQVCCRPNALVIEVDETQTAAEVYAESS